jgi:hypothetical protein
MSRPVTLTDILGPEAPSKPRTPDALWCRPDGTPCRGHINEQARGIIFLEIQIGDRWLDPLEFAHPMEARRALDAIRHKEETA